MSGDLQSWALPRLQLLLPLDDGSLKEVIAYSSTLSKDAAADHLKNLLGDSPQALEFISSFNARRGNGKPSSSTAAETGVPKPQKKVAKKAKAPLHAPGPARRPEGYGDIAGGYTKHYNPDEDFGLPSRRPASRDQNVAPMSSTPEVHQVPQPSTGGRPSRSSATSRDASPAQRPQKLPPSAAGNLISDFGFANVKSKQAKRPAHGGHSQPQSGTSTPHRNSATTTTSNVADLTAAIAALELSTNPTLSKERRKCPCNASIHPLFATAPNCLNCGKIICALEGLQPCSFCDSPILTKEQVNGMIKALKEERGIEKMAVHNAGQSQSGRGTPIFGGSTPDSASGDEASSAAARARAHRDKLLAFQRENAQRTRVHDEAADYDTTLTPGTTQWMSPVQRAAALKKQQKYLRELEEANRPEWEKKRTVMSMSVKNGKLVKTYGQEKAAPLVAEQDDQDEDDNMGDQHLSLNTDGRKGAFSNNPLLASGKLIRPVWKAAEGDDQDKGKGRAAERTSVWRRVQDDNEDNEQWILDGGLRGYGTETRLMEDGSQQECG
ncbi:C2HC5 finger protein [Cladophialophora carrionii]|uniref:C2HC5 finger protein n=1 Tax=Cladophialophora carrionii TaxID=86049 RepID=A0A1C1CPS7_9EURO|nr:C2HC5 finger protein [Cladophialophora carrionii]